MSGPNWQLNDDLKSVTVTFPTDPPVAIRLDVAEIETMLANLGNFRSTMQPEVPRTFAFGQKVQVIPDPHYATEPDALQGHSILHLRDDRYGWLHYLLPPNEAQKLGLLLQTQAANLPPSPPRDKAN